MNFSKQQTEEIKAAASFVLAHFNEGTSTELMSRAHTRWPGLPEYAWPVVMLAVEVALEFNVNQQIAEIENGTTF